MSLFDNNTKATIYIQNCIAAVSYSGDIQDSPQYQIAWHDKSFSSARGSFQISSLNVGHNVQCQICGLFRF